MPRLLLAVAVATIASGCAVLQHDAEPSPGVETCATWQGAEYAWSQADYLVRHELAAARAAACVVPTPDAPAEPTPPTPRAPPAQVPLSGWVPREEL
jgi:hypothetical protein